jgi:beta-glucosidase
MTIARADYPRDFIWGAATSSYQIEGAAFTDGREASIWDTFSRVPGKVRNGDNGNIACDHYNRLEEDLDLMSDMGLGAYRFSVAWPRVLPGGRGRVNQKGLDFYERLIDGLLERHIEPWLTLYHWDLPQALEDAGGWPARDTVHAFAEYTDVVSGRFGDRVKRWITHNEPWCTAFLGYGNGYFAPGISDQQLAVQASHHLLLSHGLAVPIIRQNASGAQVGITLNLWPIHAASDSPEDRQAARRYDGFSNRWYLDPIYGRGYPFDMLEIYGDAAPNIHDGDLETIAVKTDFLGVNYYVRMVIKDAPGAGPLQTAVVQPAGEYTDFNWEVYPDGLRELLTRLHTEYPVGGLYVTENGACYDDPVVNGQVHDAKRTRYLEQHITSGLQAVQHGVPYKGYFAWSLMDNFEWAEGYARRFGLVHVDFQTQQRTLKQSGRWYAGFLRGGMD